MQDKYYLVNQETGEVEGEFNPKEQQIKSNKQTEYIKKKYEKKTEYALYNEEYGNFYMLIYSDIIDKIELSDLTKLIYLLSYMNYDNEFKRRNKPLCRQKLQEILDLHRNNFNPFYNRMKKLGIFTETNDVVVVNRDIAVKGELKERFKYGHIRIYETTIRHLYETVPKAQHKQLGILFRFIDKLNLHTNMYCVDPLEDDLKKIKPFTIEEMMCELGYHLKSKRLFYKNLTKIKTLNDQYLCKITIVGERSLLTVNPRVMYKGKYTDAMKIESSYFNTED